MGCGAVSEVSRGDDDLPRLCVVAWKGSNDMADERGVGDMQVGTHGDIIYMGQHKFGSDEMSRRITWGMGNGIHGSRGQKERIT